MSQLFGEGGVVPCSLPYFKFFPNDWLSSRKVRTMSPEARGLYFDLLNVAWQEGGIPENPAELAGWLNFPPRKFQKAWEEIQDYWVHGPEGLLVNPRQQRERREAIEAHERRVAAGRKGGSSKT